MWILLVPPAMLLVTWFAAVIISLHALLHGANPEVPQYRNLRRAWITVLAGHSLMLPLPIIAVYVCSSPLIRDSGPSWPTFLGLLCVSVTVHVLIYVWARDARPDTEVTDKHKTLLPAMWGVFLAISLLQWLGAYLFMNLEWGPA